MVRGLYIAGTGMMLQRRRMETITNNIANADTTAYKKEHFLSHSFDEVLVRRINDPYGQRTYGPYLAGQLGWDGGTGAAEEAGDGEGIDAGVAAATLAAIEDGQEEQDNEALQRAYDNWVYSPYRAINQIWPPVGHLNLGTQVDYLYVDYSQGALEGTERSTDFAIRGENCFFVMRTPEGERYTRTGHFYVDDTGYLIDADGNRLQGENGDIYVGDIRFHVDSGGQLWTQDYQQIDTLRLVSFEDPSTLRRQGDNLYFATVEPLAETNPYTIAQGFLENSNVDIGREMVDMLTMFRAYEINQRMLTMVDETVGKAVNEIGRLR